MIAETVDVTEAAGFKTLDALRHAIDKRLLAGAVKVPMMPQVAMRVMALTTNPNTDISELSELIHHDPSLAVRVLQVANSAAYGGSETTTSLNDAVCRLGISTLGEVILSVSLHAGVFRVPGFEPEVNQLWRHSVASGYFAKEIGRCNRGDGDTLFLCGLLHSIGKPVILQLIADLRKAHNFSLKPGFLETLLDEYHLTLSSCMAAQWSLPKSVQMACAHYHNPATAPECGADAAATYLADLLASWLTSPNEIDAASLQQDSVLQSMSMGAEGIERILARKEVIQSQVAALSH